MKYKYKDEMNFENELIADSEIYYHTKYAEYSDLIMDKHANVSNIHEKVKIKIDYNFKKNKSEGENLLLISKNDTKKEAIKKIESSGYKCK